MAQRVICVVGPTASGKTKMGVALAHDRTLPFPNRQGMKCRH